MDYRPFLQDMGERPDGTTLGRINNDGNYEPGNCRWETIHVQAINRKSTKFITYEGRTMHLAAWQREFPLFLGRWRAGWPLNKIFTQPKMINSFLEAKPTK